VTDQRAEIEGAGLSGIVVEVDYDADMISVELADGSRKTLPFELFDRQDVYQPGQHFGLTLDKSGEPSKVVAGTSPEVVRTTVSGYVESVDQDDELVWVYVRTEEGWHRKVMPLSLFRESDLARPGEHFLLDLDEQGTPLGLRPDDAELEMLPQSMEQAKPRWTNRPAAEAEPED
jgi:hypothetical protein